MDVSGPLLRWERADSHLSFLLDQHLRWHSDQNRRIVGEFEPESGDYVFRVSGDPPPMDWGIRLGEFAYNLRAALDYIAWRS